MVPPQSRSGAPEKFFSVHLVQLAQNVLDRVVEPGDDDMLDRVDSSICCTDDFVEDCEGRLE